MSWWTHVNASARIDAMIFSKEHADKFVRCLKRDFGKQVKWESDEKTWKDAEEHPEKYLPYGSEGGLTIKIDRNNKLHCLAFCVVHIYGDLRDRGYSKEEIQKDFIDWFKEKLKPYMIRQAFMEVEWGGGTETWCFANDEVFYKDQQDYWEERRLKELNENEVR